MRVSYLKNRETKSCFETYRLARLNKKNIKYFNTKRYFFKSNVVFVKKFSMEIGWKKRRKKQKTTHRTET